MSNFLFGSLLCLTGILTSFGVLRIARLQYEIRRIGIEKNKAASRTEGIIRDVIFLGGIVLTCFGGDLILGAFV